MNYKRVSKIVFDSKKERKNGKTKLMKMEIKYNDINL